MRIEPPIGAPSPGPIPLACLDLCKFLLEARTLFLPRCSHSPHVLNLRVPLLHLPSHYLDLLLAGVTHLLQLCLKSRDVSTKPAQGVLPARLQSLSLELCRLCSRCGRCLCSLQLRHSASERSELRVPVREPLRLLSKEGIELVEGLLLRLQLVLLFASAPLNLKKLWNIFDFKER